MDNFVVLKTSELYEIEGGSGPKITGSIISAMEKAVKTVFNIGRRLGSTTRRLFYHNICPL